MNKNKVTFWSYKEFIYRNLIKNSQSYGKFGTDFVISKYTMFCPTPFRVKAGQEVLSKVGNENKKQKSENKNADIFFLNRTEKDKFVDEGWGVVCPCKKRQTDVADI